MPPCVRHSVLARTCRAAAPVGRAPCAEGEVPEGLLVQAEQNDGTDRKPARGLAKGSTKVARQTTDNANVSSVSSKSSSNDSRADLDTNWRDHHITNLPPTGAKGKGKVKNQKSNDKGK